MRYIVQPRDSLWSIAKHQLGDAARWPELARLNSIAPPYRLLIGQVLTVPMETYVWRPSANGLGGSSQAYGPVWTYGTTPTTEAATPATTIPVRGFVFVVIEEIEQGAKLVRKVVALPESDAAWYIVNNPDKFGFRPRAPGSSVSLGEHAMGNTLSKYISASNKPAGAPNFEGTSWVIDVNKAKASGAVIHSTKDIIKDLDRLAQSAEPALAARIAKLKSVIQSMEGEVLIEGTVPANAVKSAKAAMSEAKLLAGMTKGARVIGFVGIVLSAYDIGKATAQSYQEASIRPLAAESIRQAGGWGMGWAGFKIGAAAGAVLGVETGPGLLATGLVGGLIFGVAGYFGADWVADKIHAN